MNESSHTEDASFDRAYLAGYEAAHTAWCNRVTHTEYCIAGREEAFTELSVVSDTALKHLRSELDVIRQNRSGEK